MSEMLSNVTTEPFGLRRMRPYPPEAAIPYARVILDSDRQIGCWLDQNGQPTPALDDKHKKSQTWKKTSPKTSLDGNKDEGSDQDGDED